MKKIAALSVLPLLVACADPNAIPRLSETDVPEDAATLGAIPDPTHEAGEEGSFLSNLLAGLSGQADDNETPDLSGDSDEPGQGAELTPPESFAARSGILPYGKIALACDMPRAALGKKAAQYPARGRGYVLHDSDPGNTAPHTFYLTGFADGCARQFTASVALFGSVEMHEQLRYGLPAEVQPYSDTDKAYEKVKSRVCGVPRKKPCGNKIGRLEEDTVFLSIYENFGGNQRWSNLLLHDGRVLAHDFKG